MAVDKIETLTLRGCVTDWQKNKQTKTKKTSRDREFLGDPWGDSAEIFRVGREHSYVQKTSKLFF